MSNIVKRLENYGRLAANLPGALRDAIENRPYGWGEYQEQLATWKPEIYRVRRGQHQLAVECLLHLQDDAPQAPLYVNMGGYSTPAMLYGPLGRAVWQRGLNALMVSLPGHGHTDLPAMQYRTYRQSAKIVYEAIEQVRTEYGLTGELRVLGHSHGGGMAQAMAAEVGDAVSRYYILAGVGGPEWTRLAKLFARALEDIRRGQLFTDDVADSWQRLSGFVSDGYIVIPPPWELAGWQAELIRPFASGWHDDSLTNLYSVLVDTLLASAEELEGCLKVMGTLGADTIILAGLADGVITSEVIKSQARAAAKPDQASAPVFKSKTTHAGFLAKTGRDYVAHKVALTAEELAAKIPDHILAAA